MQGRPDFTVSGALFGTWSLLRRRAGTLLASSALLYAFPVGAFNYLAISSGMVGGVEVQRAILSPSVPLTGLLLGYIVASSLIQVIGFLLATAATVRVAYGASAALPVGIGVAAAAAVRASPAYLIMAAISGLATVLAAALLIVPGLMLFCRWSVATPALVVERAGISGSLRRSRDLTRTHRWAVLGFLLIVVLANGALFSALGLGGLALGRAIGGSAGVAAGRTFIFAVGMLANSAAVTINSASEVALYVALRRAREGVLSPEALDAFA